ncbi:hypothetical protein M0208_15535 [Sphingomonas sp. SUN019]|uniref:hypothetical protein n=1 Tax=Sphingomonas sp. SUN019 TaxID=2937788 RepID=UPI0021641825|nr:hypothetical protein [Sphingomonas sp. SUN019]UVO51853.1 hypothetical protein M0208_15535 [Sphingomonas sp. SUN019]
MPRISTIWDRTTEVLAGRAGILTVIAALLLFAPAVAQAVLAAALGEQSVVVSLWNLVALVLTIWASLSLTAVASDPAVTREGALATGVARLGPGLGVLIVAIVVAIIALLPGIVLLIVGGLKFLPNGKIDPASATGGAALIGMLYFLVLSLGALWVSARLVPLFAIVVNERRGLGAFRRSFALTRGSTMKLIGVMILYAIVLFVVFAATTTVVGLILRLALGSEATAAVSIGVAIVAGIVTAGAAVMQNVFSAQFYVATAGDRDMAPA